MNAAARELGKRIASAKRLVLDLRFTAECDGTVVVRGEETAAFDCHDDGCKTFRASSRSYSPAVVRDVIYTLKADYRPLDAFVHLQVEGRYEGSGMFQFAEDSVASMTWNRVAGTEQNRVAIAAKVAAFCAHPVTTDALLVAAFDHSITAHRQSPMSVYLSSVDPFGRTGPQLSPSSVSIEYGGTQDIDTPIGMVLCDEYSLYENAITSLPVQTIWVVHGTSIFIRSKASEPYNTSYDLTDIRLDA